MGLPGRRNPLLSARRAAASLRRSRRLPVYVAAVFFVASVLPHVPRRDPLSDDGKVAVVVVADNGRISRRRRARPEGGASICQQASLAWSRRQTGEAPQRDGEAPAEGQREEAAEQEGGQGGEEEVHGVAVGRRRRRGERAGDVQPCPRASGCSTTRRTRCTASRSAST
ncbi:hypothetical protein EE612_030099 [Oryza sativa]|nr:hypothetical protein EE612_030099 [Oryza sativa]